MKKVRFFFQYSTRALRSTSEWRGQGGGRGTGDGGRRGGRRDLYHGGKRERNSKRQAFVICYRLLPVKETNPNNVS